MASNICGDVQLIGKRSTSAIIILCEETCDNKLDYYPKPPEKIETNLDLTNPNEFEVTTTCKKDDITVNIKNQAVKILSIV
jgi:hypothetical protein